MKTNNREYRKRNRDAVAGAAEQAANSGHYLERLMNIAIAIEDRESVMAVMALKQLHVYCGSQPTGSNGMQYDISMRLLIRCERDWKFTKAQLSKLWYGVHWDTHKAFNLKFPYTNSQTNEMKSNTTYSRGA